MVSVAVADIGGWRGLGAVAADIVLPCFEILWWNTSK